MTRTAMDKLRAGLEELFTPTARLPLPKAPPATVSAWVVIHQDGAREAAHALYLSEDGAKDAAEARNALWRNTGQARTLHAYPMRVSLSAEAAQAAQSWAVTWAVQAEGFASFQGVFAHQEDAKALQASLRTGRDRMAEGLPGKRGDAFLQRIPVRA